MTFKKPSPKDMLPLCGAIGPDDGTDPQNSLERNALAREIEKSADSAAKSPRRSGSCRTVNVATNAHNHKCSRPSSMSGNAFATCSRIWLG
jgi:hypothetical protein